MNFLRSTATLTTAARRATPLALRQSIRPLSTATPRRAHQGYGDGKGDPVGENPQDQGSSNATKQNAEHPGPEPPREGQNTGAGPTKAGSNGQKGGAKSPEDASANSGGSRSKEAKETGSSPTGGSVGGKNASAPSSSGASDGEAHEVKEEGKQRAQSAESKKPAAQPKILSQDPGEDNSKEKQEEVRQHNKEFEERYDRAAPAKEDAVDQKFWQGE